MDLPLPLLITLFSLIGGVLSLIGGFFLLWNSDLVRRISIHLVTFAAGTLLGVAFLDLLPEALEEGAHNGKAPIDMFIWVLVGIVTFFIMERILLRMHTHDELEDADANSHHHISRSSSPWLITIGDGLHNFIDGVAITAAFLVSVPTGIITAIAVAAHEIPQEISDFSILLHGGLARRKVAWLNIGAALMTTVGALIAFAARDSIEPILGPLLAFATGIFVYIASSDLIPEIHAKTHRDKPSHIIVILVGAILLTYGLITYTHQYVTQSEDHAQEIQTNEERLTNYSGVGSSQE